MIITNFTIANFKPFNPAEIHSVSCKYDSPIQVIIGDNGTGKSSMLNELNPTAPSKPDYNKKGFKYIELVHDKKVFELTSDFSNKLRTHSFIMDGEELNISGIQGVQNELVGKYLGYTDMIRKLTYFTYKFTDMTKSERKNLLLSIVPIDLDFILELHKKVLSKIRENKNNLNLLYQRKSDIENNLIEKQLYENIIKDKSEKSILYDNINKMIFLLEQELQVKRTNHSSLSVIALDHNEIKSFCKSLSNSLYNYSSVSRKTLIEDIEKNKEHNNKLQYEIAMLTESINIQKNELDKLKELQLQNDKIGDISILEEEKNELFKTLSSITIDDSFKILTPSDISNIMEEESAIVESCISLIAYRSSLLYNNKQFNKLLKLEFKVTNILNSVSSQISILENSLQITESEKREVLLLSPAPTCKSLCELKDEFITRSKKFNMIIEGYKTQLLRFKTKEKILSNRLEQIVVKKNEQLPYQNTISKLKDIFNKQPILYRIFEGENVTEMLRIDPLSIPRRITLTIENSQKMIDKNKLQEEHDKIEKQLLLIKQTNIPTMSFILDQITNKQKKYIENYNRLSDSEVRLNENIHDTNKKKFIYSNIEKMSSLIKEFESYKNYIVSEGEITYITELLSKLRSYQMTIQENLISTETVIKEQSSLLSRYNDEILIMINDIEKNKKKYELLEKALSPNKGIPHSYLLTFINNLITNVNYFISEIWTYPLSINTIDEHVVNDFNLSINVMDELVPDISSCSSGQKDIINICFILAILLHMQKLDKFPLYMDEPDAALDVTHRQKLLEFLANLIDQKIITQMFIVNHHIALSNGFSLCEVLCLSDNNIVTPETYNEHAKIK